jgi:TatA/E family protein of Tat protein translocase
VSLGPAEILVILVIALLVFGPTRLPEVGRQVGRTMREFRRFQQVMRRDLDDVFGHDDHVSDVSHAAEPPPTLPPKTDAPAPPPAAEAEASANGDGDSPDRPEPGGPHG